MKEKAADIRLISQLVLWNDKRAFDSLVLKYQSSVRRFIMHLTMGDQALSEDLAQETFIKAYLNIKSFQAVSGFSTWLFRIAYNVFYDSVRTRKYFEEIDVETIDNSHQVTNSFSSEKEDIYKALSLLRKEEQVVLLLFYMEDKTQKEIAGITGYPLGTVKTFLLKGKERVKDYLIKAGYGE
ncbi:RNA polymerase sigma-70 factor (ECF subfamily) [Parabacteroides sp. PFB2-10]|uniref:sigma-70 family RNA polymerase sigma factor n=1 Tax=Parabacteroides sp. PFB2-10 TaxID=1742405 RepID=UPI002476CF58|nr:sigma-70 family RNA polymerase sigma factor [Parabacteroides sp. PFB2-10]MDH6313228.1 RNA polymerase sigma-70 factor (ECF subfamily) [Parabacteroides sp. PFB2-10]